MNELDREIAEEIDDEALFRLAEGEHTFSPEYQEQMERLYKRAAPRTKRKMTPLRRLVAVAAIIALLTGTAAATTFWEEIQQFFVTTFARYVELRTGPDVPAPEMDFSLVPEEWESYWVPRKNLGGYSPVSAETLGERKVITFVNGDDRLQFSQWPVENKMTADSEGKTVEGIFIGEVQAHAIEKVLDGMERRSITWIEGDTSLQLYGSLSFDALSEIANNVVYIER